MSIGVLGPLIVGDDGAALAPRERVVLAALAVRRGDFVSADVLAEALWGDDLPPASWTKVVQGCIVRLRKVLGADAIETRDGGYRLAIAADEVDANCFERLVGRGELLMLGEPDRALFVADEALGLWRGGRALVDVDDWEHGRIEAMRLDELRRDAEELRLDAALRAGRYREVLAEAQTRVAQAPLREQRWVLLAHAQYQAGRQGDALRTLHQGRQVLVGEAGLDPGPDMVALERAILRQDPALIASRLPGPSPACPYLGMVPYDVSDAEAFFGREREVAECVRRLSEHQVVTVVGPSGSGKSSFVRAGLAAALSLDGRRVVVITPGARPMDAYATVGRAGAPAVLVVDQCEEALTLCADVNEQSRFFAALADHATTATLVVALRADRFGDLSAHPDFARLAERGVYLLKAMDDEHLREAIEVPARQAGLLLEPGLVDVLVRDVEGEPGSLPLLSHALRQTWERREGNTLTVAGYRASGGIHGAVALTAELVYERTSPERHQMLRDLMLRLVSPNADGDPVRARVPRRAIAPDPERAELVDTLVAARLVTADVETLELAHEALARAWPRLREWLDDDVEGQRMWRHLATAAETWARMGRPDSELYRGTRLARVIEWSERTTPDLNATEQAFVDGGARLADAERHAVAEQARRQARSHRRLRVLAACVAVLALVATIGGIAALRQARRADREADLARTHELAASAVAAVDEDPTLAKLLAASAAEIDEPTLAVSSALHRALATDLSVARYGFPGEVGAVTADIDPDGDRIVAAGTFQPEGAGWTVEVVDPATDEQLWAVDVSASRQWSAVVVQPFFTADGEQVVTSVMWDPYNWRRAPVPLDGIDEPTPDLLGAHFRAAGTGELVERFDLGRCGGVVVAASPTHLLAKTLHGPADVVEACRWRDGSIGVELIDRRTGAREVLTSATSVRWGWGAALSDDGRYAAYDDGAVEEVVVVDVATGAEVLRQRGAGVRDLNITGSLLIVGDGPISVWDVASGAVTATFDGHNGPSEYARFGPTGATVYSNGDDGALREWDALDGRQRLDYPNLGTGPVGLNDDGHVVVTDIDQQVVTVLDTRARGEVDTVATCDGSASADTLTVVDGVAALHTECVDESTATTYVVDLERGATLAVVPDREPGPLAVSPDGARFVDQELRAVGAGRDLRRGPLAVRDLRTGASLVELDALPDQPEPGSAQRLRWSPDGTMIAAAVGGQVALWDAATGSLRHRTDQSDDGDVVVDVLFTADSAELIATTTDWRITARSVRSWDVAVERELFVEGGYRLGLVGPTADRSSLLAIGGFQHNAASALVWLDPQTFDPQRVRPNIHEGSVVAAALSADTSLVATASSDGSIRVWNVASGNLVDESPGNGSVVNGVAFVDDRHLVVASERGELLTITIDPHELLSIARTTLTRGLTLAECERFNFSEDCPTIAELGSLPTGTDEPHGSFEITWSRDDLVNTATRWTTEHLGTTPAPQFFDTIEGLAADLAGHYTVTFADGRFDIVNDRVDDPYCSGTYVVRGNRIWLRSERGGVCYPIKLFDATFELSNDSLRFEPTSFRGELPHALVFASRPLEPIR